MSVIDESFMTTDDYREMRKSGIKETVAIDENVNADKRDFEILCCFVCDVRVQGRHYPLATCKTQTSRFRVIEKLAQLVGERYVVVISEDDVVCRNCAYLINTLDRLESEMREARHAVLGFLEQKYSLVHGELSSGDCNDISRSGQQPQIMRSERSTAARPTIDDDSRKRRIIVRNDGIIEHQVCSSKRDDERSSTSSSSSSSTVWMECDKCSYATRKNILVARHARPARTKNNARCDKCGIEYHQGRKVSRHHHCSSRKDPNNENNNRDEKDNLEERRAIQTAPLETIALSGAAAADYTEDDAAIVTIAPSITIQTNHIESLISKNDEEIHPIDFADSTSVGLKNFLKDDGEGSPPLFVRVSSPRQLGVSKYIAAQRTTNFGTGSGKNVITGAKKNTAQRTMTLTEDESLEIMAVDCWNENDRSESNNETIV